MAQGNRSPEWISQLWQELTKPPAFLLPPSQDTNTSKNAKNDTTNAWNLGDLGRNWVTNGSSENGGPTWKLPTRRYFRSVQSYELPFRRRPSSLRPDFGGASGNSELSRPSVKSPRDDLEPPTENERLQHSNSKSSRSGSPSRNSAERDTTKRKGNKIKVRRRTVKSATGRTRERNRVLGGALDSAIIREWNSVLARANIPAAVLDQYPWEPSNLSLHENVVKVDTLGGKGTYALKRAHIPAQKLQFLHELIEYATQRGFQQVANYALSHSKRPYANNAGQTFYATKWVVGNPVNFASVQHVSKTAATLASFHEATRGFESSGYNPEGVFRLQRLYKVRSNELHTILAELERKSRRDAFDELLYEMASELSRQAKACLAILENERCVTFLEKDEEVPGICHLDVIPGNFIYAPDKQVVLLDLELATYAPRVLDLSHLLRRSLERFNWSQDIAYSCFVEFDSVRTMSEEEYLLVEALLTFPYRAWRLAHTRYRVLKDDAQIDEMRDVVAQEERRQAFLKALSDQIRNLRDS